MIRRPIALFVVAFALHFIWEMAHAKWYATMNALPFWTATAWCARAALVDVGISAAAYAAAALLARNLRWAREAPALPVAMYLVAGLAVTVVIERWAIGVGRWQYAPGMPTIAGVGLSPLLQWVVVPLLIAAAARAVMGSRRSPR